MDVRQDFWFGWTELDQQADQAARAWVREIGGWPGVEADRSFRAGWKAAAKQLNRKSVNADEFDYLFEQRD